MKKVEKIKYTDGRANNGGSRVGAGRPIGKRQEAYMNYLMEDVLVYEKRFGQTRRVKKKRVETIMDSLFKQAINENSIKAAKSYFNLLLDLPNISNNPDMRFNRNMVAKAITYANVREIKDK